MMKFRNTLAFGLVSAMTLSLLAVPAAADEAAADLAVPGTRVSPC